MLLGYVFTVNVPESTVSNNKQMHNKFYYLDSDHQHTHFSKVFCISLKFCVSTAEKQERKERNAIPLRQNVLWTYTLINTKMSVLEL